ncbi:MAG: hypothetical protein ACK4Q5_20935, partial [Saprospiraceae bacterium]
PANQDHFLHRCANLQAITPRQFFYFRKNTKFLKILCNRAIRYIPNASGGPPPLQPSLSLHLDAHSQTLKKARYSRLIYFGLLHLPHQSFGLP